MNELHADLYGKRSGSSERRPGTPRKVMTDKEETEYLSKIPFLDEDPPGGG